jgi:hypothetical protein
MYVVVEAQQAGQHKFVYCEVLQVRNMWYYFKNNSGVQWCWSYLHQTIYIMARTDEALAKFS